MRFASLYVFNVVVLLVVIAVGWRLGVTGLTKRMEF